MYTKLYLIFFTKMWLDYTIYSSIVFLIFVLENMNKILYNAGINIS